MSDMVIETINENHNDAIEESSDRSTNEQHEQAPTEAPTETKPSINIKSIPQKKICELTDNEKKALYEASLRNEYNDYYEVKHHANGKYRIIHRKPKTIAQHTDAQDKTKQSKVYMSDNQLVWMHLLDLEQKYERLYNKHKKLKRKYNDLYIEDDDIIETPPPLKERNEAPTTIVQEHDEEPQPQPQPQPQPIYNAQSTSGVEAPLRATNYVGQSTVTYAQPITNWRTMMMRKHFN